VIVRQHVAFSARLRERGVLVDGDAIEPLSKLVRNGLVAEGPFAETKEQLGGYYVLDCEGLYEALEWARQVPLSPVLVVEVRPLGGLAG
jgi:hypothetical protein